MAKSKGPSEISAGAYPFVLTNPESDPNLGGGDGTPVVKSYGSVKSKQARSDAAATADAVEHIVKSVVGKRDEEEVPELKVTSK